MTTIDTLLAHLDKLPDSNMQATEVHYLLKTARQSISPCVFKPDDDDHFKPLKRDSKAR